MIKLLIILFIIYFIYNYFKSKKTIVIPVYNKIHNKIHNKEVYIKPYLWQYWDNIDSVDTPAYIKLCFDTVDKHCKDFNIVRLNKENILDYLPELKTLKIYDKINTLIIAHKVDLYRIMLLKKYGGVYMDADIIVLRNPIEIITRLKSNDFVGFGCTGVFCKNGLGEPSNWLMASRKEGILVTKVLDNMINKISTYYSFDYHDLGKIIIWEELKKLMADGYNYYHYPNTIDGSRDKNGIWIEANFAFSNIKIDYDDEDNMMFFILYNSMIPKNIKELSREEILNQDWNFTKFLKKSIF
jgi:hypothetical protein